MRFHLFLFDQYYAGGGMDDFEGSFETLEEAMEAPRRGQLWQIAESTPQGLKIVASSTE